MSSGTAQVLNEIHPCNKSSLKTISVKFYTLVWNTIFFNLISQKNFHLNEPHKNISMIKRYLNWWERTKWGHSRERTIKSVTISPPDSLPSPSLTFLFLEEVGVRWLVQGIAPPIIPHPVIGIWLWGKWHTYCPSHTHDSVSHRINGNHPGSQQCCPEGKGAQNKSQLRFHLSQSDTTQDPELSAENECVVSLLHRLSRPRSGFFQSAQTGRRPAPQVQDRCPPHYCGATKTQRSLFSSYGSQPEQLSRVSRLDVHLPRYLHTVTQYEKQRGGGSGDGEGGGHHLNPPSVPACSNAEFASSRDMLKLRQLKFWTSRL
jgi:hypothetical protein